MKFKNMHSTTCLLSLLICLTLSLEAKIYPPQGKSISDEKLTPNNTIIAFDIHGVLVQRDTLGIITKLLNNVGMLYAALRIDVLQHLYQTKTTTCAEDYVFDTLQKFPELEGYKPILIDILNSQTPTAGMAEVLEQLHDDHYPLYVLSNIGHYMYHGWENSESQQKSPGLKDIYPHLFNFFIDAHINARKPINAAYSNFTTSFNGDGSKNIVFIDDSKKNIEEAAKNGFWGILYENMQTLEHDLAQLGIGSKK